MKSLSQFIKESLNTNKLSKEIVSKLKKYFNDDKVYYEEVGQFYMFHVPSITGPNKKLDRFVDLFNDIDNKLEVENEGDAEYTITKKTGEHSGVQYIYMKVRSEGGWTITTTFEEAFEIIDEAVSKK